MSEITTDRLAVANCQLHILAGGRKIIRVVLAFTVPRGLAKPLLLLVLLCRRIRYGYAFRRIGLTRGKFAIVDAEDYDRLNRYRWHVCRSAQTWYAVHSVTNGKNGPRKNLYMHHLVIEVPAGMHCDHINHNGLDNRKANLRAVTRAQNARNRRKFTGPCRSRYKGVDWSESMKGWRARIRVDGERVYLGTFKSEMAAARAYDAAARRYHGRFGCGNFPNCLTRQCNNE